MTDSLDNDLDNVEIISTDAADSRNDPDGIEKIEAAAGDVRQLSGIVVRFADLAEKSAQTQEIAAEAQRLKSLNRICATEAITLSKLVPALLSDENPIGLYSERPTQVNVANTVSILEQTVEQNTQEIAASQEENCETFQTELADAVHEVAASTDYLPKLALTEAQAVYLASPQYQETPLTISDFVAQDEQDSCAFFCALGKRFGPAQALNKLEEILGAASVFTFGENSYDLTEMGQGKLVLVDASAARPLYLGELVAYVQAVFDQQYFNTLVSAAVALAATVTPEDATAAGTQTCMLTVRTVQELLARMSDMVFIKTEGVNWLNAVEVPEPAPVEVEEIAPPLATEKFAIQAILGIKR